jgi:uncharacterized protein (DUF1501 family)
MNILTRRSFVKRSTLGALGTLGVAPAFVQNAVAASSIPWNGNKVLFIFLRGGNDAVNTVIPTGDDSYNTTHRPTLHIPGPSAGLTTSGLCDEAPESGRGIDLGNGFASLNPALNDLCGLFNAGELAMIHRVGYPRQSRSHFDSEVYWESGIPRDKTPDDGLFYRTVTETGWHLTQDLPAVSLQENLPVSLQGKLPLANINSPERFDLRGTRTLSRQKELDAIQRLYASRYPEKKNRERVHATGARFVSAIPQLLGLDFDANGLNGSGEKLADSAFLDDDAAQTHLFPVNSATDDKGFDSGSAFSMMRQLKMACQVLGGTDAVVTGIQVGGYDTHQNQGQTSGSHARLLSRLGWALYAARKYMSHADVNIWNNTTIVTLSEFGRTTIENGSSGTDHGEAGVMFMASGNPAFQGGVYHCDGATWATGENGALFDTSGRYLSRRIDYRSVLGEMLRDHLAIPQNCIDRIIPGYANPVEVLATGGTAYDGIPIIGEPGLFA